MAKARKIVVAGELQREPRAEDFRVEEEELPPLHDGQVLAEAVYVSVDPCQGALHNTHRVGSQVARIVESQAAGFPAGALVVGWWGWRDRTVAEVGAGAASQLPPPALVPDLGDLPLSLSLGPLGMPGVAAYFGLLEICRPKEGEVAVVSGAAGAVGSVAGQVARLQGCKVVGLAGSDTEVKWLKDELGFHHAYNYKTADVADVLKEAAPDGVDVYFDTVGGELSSTVISSMREWGRIAVCGDNAAAPAQATIVQPAAVAKQLRMEGFQYTRWQHRWPEAVPQLARWVSEGKLKFREVVTEGFQNAPTAFVGMLRGDNVGTAVVKV